MPGSGIAIDVGSSLNAVQRLPAFSAMLPTISPVFAIFHLPVADFVVIVFVRWLSVSPDFWLLIIVKLIAFRPRRTRPPPVLNFLVSSAIFYRNVDFLGFDVVFV